MWPELTELFVIAAGLVLWSIRSWTARRDTLVLPVILILAFAVESVAILVQVVNATGTMNNWVYNLYLPLDAGATAYLTVQLLGFKKGLRLASKTAAAYACVSMLELMAYNDWMAFSTKTYVVFSLVACVGLVMGLFRLSQSVEQPLSETWLFWASFGQLLYYGGMLPFNGLVEHIHQSDQELAFRLSIINPLIAICRYLFILIAITRTPFNPRKSVSA